MIKPMRNRTVPISIQVPTPAAKSAWRASWLLVSSLRLFLELTDDTELPFATFACHGRCVLAFHHKEIITCAVVCISAVCVIARRKRTRILDLILHELGQSNPKVEMLQYVSATIGQKPFQCTKPYNGSIQCKNGRFSAHWVCRALTCSSAVINVELPSSMAYSSALKVWEFDTTPKGVYMVPEK